MRWAMMAVILMAAGAGCAETGNNDPLGRSLERDGAGERFVTRNDADLRVKAKTAENAAADTLPTSKADLLSLYVDVQAIGRERALTLYRLAMETSDKALKAGEYDRAAEAARDAMAVLEVNRAYLGESESAALRAGAQSGEVNAGAQKLAAAQAKTVGMVRGDMAEAARAQRARRVTAALDDARTFAEQRRYIEAIDSLKQALVLDPSNDQAKLQMKLLGDKIGYREYDRAGQRQAAEGMKQGVSSKETTIPYSDVMVYPEDWVEKSRRRAGD